MVPAREGRWRGGAGKVPLFAIAFFIASIVVVARKSMICFARSAFFFRSEMSTPLIDALPAFTRSS